MEDKGDWLSIVEYSQRTGISISTIRRRIKNEKIKYQSIGGKYFIYSDEVNSEEVKTSDESLMLRLEIERLNKIITHQREEMEDLRMLVQLYEGQQQTERKSIVTTELPPELPLM